MEGDVWESLCWRLQKAAFLQSPASVTWAGALSGHSTPAPWLAPGTLLGLPPLQPQLRALKAAYPGLPHVWLQLQLQLPAGLPWWSQ